VAFRGFLHACGKAPGCLIVWVVGGTDDVCGGLLDLDLDLDPGISAPALDSSHAQCHLQLYRSTNAFTVIMAP
jgi:hypothetical protein